MKLSFLLVSILFLTSCGRNHTEQSDTKSAITRDGPDVPLMSLDRFEFGELNTLTPSGREIFRAALTWKERQWEFRNSISAKRVFATPEARMCAGNLSQVLNMTKIASMNAYRWTAVDEVFTAIRNTNTKVYRFPKTKAGVISSLEKLHNGYVPVGSILGGCLEIDANDNCLRIDGSRHMGLIGDTKVEIRDGKRFETIMAYHNNWYRPANAAGQHLPFMVSKRNLNDGFPREWMATPWLTIIRDLANDEIIDVQTSLINPVTGGAALDDLDPFTFHTFVAVLPAIQQDIDKGQIIQPGDTVEPDTDLF